MAFEQKLWTSSGSTDRFPNTSRAFINLYIPSWYLKRCLTYLSSTYEFYTASKVSNRSTKVAQQQVSTSQCIVIQQLDSSCVAQTMHLSWQSWKQGCCTLQSPEDNMTINIAWSSNSCVCMEDEGHRGQRTAKKLEHTMWFGRLGSVWRCLGSPQGNCDKAGRLAIEIMFRRIWIVLLQFQ